LAACGGPLDQSLVTDSTPQAYRASLEPAFAQLTPHQQEAFNWAVSDFDLAKLHAKYPNASPRTIVRGEVAEVLHEAPARIAAFQSRLQATAGMREDLAKLTVVEARFRIKKDFFGLQPQILIAVHNGSSKPVSMLRWRADLYLDDIKEPVASTVITDDYRRDGGLRPGEKASRLFTIGFVRGDETWTTLEIRNAQRTRVELTPLLDSIADFGERPYLPEDPAAELERLQVLQDKARSFEDI
jgi:hypothetical protein